MTYKIKPVLVVIDLQNCFVSKGDTFDKLGYDIKKYQKIIPVVKEVYQQAKLLKIPVFFSRATREQSGIDLLEKVHKIIPLKRKERIEKSPLSIKGTWDVKIIDSLKPASNDLIVEKRRDSIFQYTEFEMWLNSLKIDTLVFVGIDTSICVESSLRSAFDQGWDIILLSDATASLNKKFWKSTLMEVKENFGLVLESKEFLKNLKKKKGERFYSLY